MSFDTIFNCIYLAVLGYQALYFLVQYTVLKRVELFYYSLFLLVLVFYYSVYLFVPLLHNHQRPFANVPLTSMQMNFMVVLNIFYMRFLLNYLDLRQNKSKLSRLLKFYVWVNLFLLVVFIITGLCKIEGDGIFLTASAITMPFTIAVLILLWMKKGVYARVAAIGMSFAVVGESLCHLFIKAKTDTYNLYGGSAYTMAQAAVMIDVFILGYGLSLRAAESDKKLVQTLLENQQIVETERSRLAKDLHDGLGGMLSGIKLTLGSIPGNMVLTGENSIVLTKAIHQLDNTITEMRRVAHSMMPEALLRFGLSEAIQDYCDWINESNLVKMKFTQIGLNDSIEKPTEVILYRIVQELSNNAIKHATAENIFIQLNKHEKGLTLTVEDDGKGFTITQNIKGDGLQNVQSRVAYLKGSMEINSKAGEGSSFTIEIPKQKM
jgi:signal transduction histidine kinase